MLNDFNMLAFRSTKGLRIIGHGNPDNKNHPVHYESRLRKYFILWLKQQFSSFSFGILLKIKYRYDYSSHSKCFFLKLNFFLMSDSSHKMAVIIRHGVPSNVQRKEMIRCYNTHRAQPMREENTILFGAKTKGKLIKCYHKCPLEWAFK
jgi:hypothetical protein